MAGREAAPRVLCLRCSSMRGSDWRLTPRTIRYEMSESGAEARLVNRMGLTLFVCSRKAASTGCERCSGAGDGPWRGREDGLMSIGLKVSGGIGRATQHLYKPHAGLPSGIPVVRGDEDSALSSAASSPETSPKIQTLTLTPLRHATPSRL
eukprot:ctg_39.g2